jgi:hypothetical protein
MGLASAFLICASASASLVTYSGTTTTVGGATVYPSAAVTTPDGTVNLSLTGAGVRHKFGLSAYVAANYVGDVAQFRTDAKNNLMDAVAGQKVRVINLTVTALFGLSASQIQTAFNDALTANHVQSDKITTLLNDFNFGLSRGASALMITFPKGDQESLVVEAGGKTLEEDDTNIGTDFWKIWFGSGESSDADLMSLQQQLIGG